LIRTAKALVEHRGDNPSPDPGEVTRLLAASADGSTTARDRLVAILFNELHSMARARMRGERAGHTLGATGLVNETYLRLFRYAQPDGEAAQPWANRAVFFSAAATAMRRILIEHARARKAAKRGGDVRPTSAPLHADAVAAAESMNPDDFLALDEAISRLEQVDHRAAEVVRLRFFAGQSIEEVAAILGTSDRTIKRDWQFARAWLHDVFDPS
jgi:RNA polymerase sigma factor (TIGR02999 family)